MSRLNKRLLSDLLRFLTAVIGFTTLLLHILK
jgi:hypothetical protein